MVQSPLSAPEGARLWVSAHTHCHRCGFTQELHLDAVATAQLRTVRRRLYRLFQLVTPQAVCYCGHLNETIWISQPDAPYVFDRIEGVLDQLLQSE